MKQYRFIDLFAGLGGFQLALEKLGCKIDSDIFYVLQNRSSIFLQRLVTSLFVLLDFCFNC